MKTTTLLFGMIFLFSSALGQNSKEYHLLVGTYSTKDNPNGIHLYRFDAESGEFKVSQPVVAAVNASYLAISADRKKCIRRK